MAKQKFERTKEHLNIGTIGHVDHGKTTFSAAISLVSSRRGFGSAVAFDAIDNAPEEKKRGITIKASTIEFETAKYHYSLTDCPGHADYIKNMITGSSQADSLFLVIAADDGRMQQTDEHVLLAKQNGVKNLFVFVNKIDVLEDPDLLEIVKEEAVELVEKHGFKNVPVFAGSALAALNGDPEAIKNIEGILDALDGVELPPRKTDEPFLLPVESVHVIQGRGTVVTGKIEQGIVKVGDQVEVVSERKGVYKVTVTGIEMFHKELDEGRAGDNIGLLLRGISKTDIGRGDIVAVPGSVKPYSRFRANVYIATPEEGGRKKAFGPNYRPQFFLRSADVTGTVMGIFAQEGENLEEKKIAMPGDNIVLEIELICKVGIQEGLRFTIREGGRTIGVGVIDKIIG